MLVHGLFVECVDLRCVGESSGGTDLLGGSFDRRPVTPGEKKLGSLARKRPCDSAADRACSSLDHRNLVLQPRLLVSFVALRSPERLDASAGHTERRHAVLDVSAKR